MLRNLPAVTIAFAALAVPSVAFAQDEDGDRRQSRVEIDPYIEASQVLLAELSPDNDVVTYSRIAAGVDASVNGRNTKAALSLRYERRIGWDDDAPDGDLISGIARASIGIVPRTLTLEAGGLAARTRVDGNGSSILSPIIDDPGQSNIYAGYVGPSLTAHAGDVDIEGHYRLGYTRVEEPDALVTAPGVDPVDVFDDSVIHSAQVRIGTRPNTVLPVGVGVGAGWYQEEISNLDQRVKDRWVRGDVSVPLSPSFAVAGGVGYEDVEVSSRDALRDGMGDPIVGSDGRYVTDPNSERTLAYDTDGLIWDVGVLWRPSRRTSLEAHVGRRYGSTSYYGTLAYQPNARSSFNVSVYDTISGFGGQVTSALAALPTEFQATRNPLSGDIGGCVESLEGGTCLGNVLGAVRSSTFRARGVLATYAVKLGRWQAGIGGGYDQRKFIGAEGTVLEASNGLKDESIWAAMYLNGQLSDHSSLSTSIYANWFDSGFDLAGSTAGYGASAAYYHAITSKLSATAAVSVDGVQHSEDTLEDEWTTAALLGLRYTF